MAQRNPDDPYRPDAVQDDPRAPSRFDSDLQIDPEMSEGRVSGGRIAAFAVAIALLFAAVFYGMNVSSTDPGAPVVATQNAPNSANQTDGGNVPPTPPGVRDVTPKSNTQPGTTTGAAPAPKDSNMISPPASQPTGREAARGEPGK